MDTVLVVLRFIGVLFLVLMIFNFMILVHEYGHYIAARWRGLVVDRFQIWFGKPIWKKTVNGVQYGLGSIPAGGFVSLPQMVTMESIEGKVDDDVKEELPPISPLDKIIVAAAGPLFSFLLAVVFAVIAWGVKYPKTEREMTTMVGRVVEGSIAEKAGIKVGDKIKAVGGTEIEKFGGMGRSVQWQIMSSEFGMTDLVLERDGKEITVQVPIEKPKPKKAEGGGAKVLGAIFNRPPLPTIGIGPRTTAIVDKVSPNGPGEVAGLQGGDRIISIDGKPVKYSDEVQAYPWEQGKVTILGIKRGEETIDVKFTPRPPEHVEIENEEALAAFNEKPPMVGISFDYRGEHWLTSESPAKIIKDSALSIYRTLQKVFNTKSGVSGGHLSGPVGIVGILMDFLMQEDGWRTVLLFGALLNVNLAILNLMPFPVLDGGHIVMATTEWIRRKPTPVKLLEILQTTFVMLLFGFMIFISLKDVGDRLPGQKEKYDVRWEPLPKS